MSDTKAKYNRAARIYDFFTSKAEKKWFAKWRSEFFSPLTGQILEVGIGTGKSLPFYNEKAEVVGIDFSDAMLQQGEERLRLLGKTNITMQNMDVEALDFADNSFDYVLTSCVLCSVPNPVKALKEMRRVMKPEGRIMLIEHVLSRNQFIAFLEHVHNPLTRVFLGENINRDTRQNIIAAGMDIVEEKDLAIVDVFRLFVVKQRRTETF